MQAPRLWSRPVAESGPFSPRQPPLDSPLLEFPSPYSVSASFSDFIVHGQEKRDVFFFFPSLATRLCPCMFSRGSKNEELTSFVFFSPPTFFSREDSFIVGVLGQGSVGVGGMGWDAGICPLLDSKGVWDLGGVLRVCCFVGAEGAK